jgi:uncharacterized protein YbjQ (UPF0145 family)
MSAVCARCGAKPRFFGLPFLTHQGTGERYCSPCFDAVAAEARAQDAAKLAGDDDARMRQSQRTEAVREAAASVILTTTPKVDGYIARRYLGIESVEYVIGTGLFSEVSGDIADFLGRRSKSFERKLQEAKRTAMEMLRIVAAEAGANAVLSVDLDYAEFSGNRVALILSGTLVELERIPGKGTDATRS